MTSPLEELIDHIKKAKKEHGDSLIGVSIRSDFHYDILNVDKEDVNNKIIEGIKVSVSSFQGNKISNRLNS